MNDTTERENLAQTLAEILPDASIIHATGDIDAPGAVLHVAVPKGMTLQEIDTEKLMDNPRRTVGKASFADAPSFLAYIKRHTKPSTVVWCRFDPQTFSLSFEAVLDDHTLMAAGWRGHRATFTPDMSAEWKAWKGKHSQQMPQVQFAEWIQEHDSDINSAAEGFPTSLQMLQMATEFVAHEEHVLKSAIRLQSGGVRLTYVADADKGTTDDMRLFEKFCLGIPVFHGGEAWRMEARLKYRNNAGKVSFFYELVRADIVHGSAAKELINTIGAGLGGLPLLMGACA